jgi:hypothetical protein
MGICNRVLKRNIFISPQELINSGWKGKVENLGLMELDIECFSHDFRAVVKHAVQKVMVFFLLPVLKFRFQHVELDTD